MVQGQTLPSKRDCTVQCAKPITKMHKKSYAAEKLQEHNLNR